MQPSKYAVNKPYPSLENIKPNSRDARILLEDYAGLVSELTATTQYVYHQMMAKNQDLEEIGQTILGIAIIEMRHLNILGDTLIKLGADPKFMNPIKQTCNKNQWWTGGLVCYLKEIIAILEEDISYEIKTIINYRKHAEEVSQIDVANVLLRIVEDEELHVEIFTSLLDKVKNSLDNTDCRKDTL